MFNSVNVGFGVTTDPTRRSNLKCYLARPLVFGGKEIFPEMRDMTLQLAKIFRTLKWWVNSRGPDEASASPPDRRSARHKKTQQYQTLPAHATPIVASPAYLPKRRRLPSEILEADDKFKQAVGAIVNRKHPSSVMQSPHPCMIENIGSRRFDDDQRTRVQRVEMAAQFCLVEDDGFNVLGAAQKYCDGIDTETSSEDSPGMQSVIGRGLPSVPGFCPELAKLAEDRHDVMEELEKEKAANEVGTACCPHRTPSLITSALASRPKPSMVEYTLMARRRWDHGRRWTCSQC